MSESLNSDQQQQLLFMMLLQQHEQIAMMGMGKIMSPVTNTIERDLKSAKYAIDTLVMLEKFTSGNLSKELSGYLTQMLNTLRLNYADEKKKDAIGASKKEESPKKEEGTKNEDGSKSGDSSKTDASSKKDESSKNVGAQKNPRPDTSGEDNSKKEEK